METEEFFITVDGMRVHAKLDRPGDAVAPLCIIFHGFTGHMEEEHIVAVARALNEEGVAALRVELYGHGKSDGAFHDHTLYKWITQGLAVIDYAQGLDFVSDIYLCGHSQGGLLTMLLAGMRTGDIAAAMPLSAATVILDGARMGNLAGSPFDPDRIPDEIGEGPLALSGDYARVAQTLHIEDEIDRYKGPVLLVHGTADAAVPFSYSQEAAARYHDARLVAIEGADHNYHGHLDEAIAAVHGFVRDLR